MIYTNTRVFTGLYVNSTLGQNQEPIYVDFDSTVNDKYVLVLPRETKFCKTNIISPVLYNSKAHKWN